MMRVVGKEESLEKGEGGAGMNWSYGLDDY